MWISFDELPESARVWIYQANREIDASTELEILKSLQDFIQDWAAHGSPLRGSARVYHKRFVVVGLDESYNAVSGCSTDASVNAIKAIGAVHQIDFFDRTQLAFLMDGQIKVYPLANVRNKEVPGDISPDTITFNNLIQVKADLDNAWKQPVRETWLARYVS
ncbi:hypothetical protein [Fulvivirga sedimenti]|uniref:ABC transporter ATPase n=1 Tax=Fulvivirga sedimenti TaxID=2879465 RepID=A0A9X1HUJ4_9BACT|nr:hypothetical protein [Fulvivirga sedimenti]MCA6078564.1 hypothetical protein [Fulvivirga sedimenti]